VRALYSQYGIDSPISERGECLTFTLDGTAVLPQPRAHQRREPVADTDFHDTRSSAKARGRRPRLYCSVVMGSPSIRRMLPDLRTRSYR